MRSLDVRVESREGFLRRGGGGVGETLGFGFGVGGGGGDGVLARRLDGRAEIHLGGFEGGLLLLWWEDRGGGGGGRDADAEARKSRLEVQWWHSGGWRSVIPLGWSVQGGGGRGTCCFWGDL